MESFQATLLITLERIIMKRYLKLGLLALAGAVTLSTTALISQPPAFAEPGQILQELDLTAEQQSQIQAIFEARRSDIEAILSEDQRDQFFDTLQENRNFREAIAAADLTEAQQDEIRTVMQTSRGEISEILTEEQRQELRDLMTQRRQERRQERPQ
jgi:protein CpxP